MSINHGDVSWWRHPILETFSALLALYAGNSPVTGEFPHKGQWRGTLMFSLICAWICGWVNNREAGDLRRHSAHYGIIVMWLWILTSSCSSLSRCAPISCEWLRCCTATLDTTSGRLHRLSKLDANIVCSKLTSPPADDTEIDVSSSTSLLLTIKFRRPSSFTIDLKLIMGHIIVTSSALVKHGQHI